MTERVPILSVCWTSLRPSSLRSVAVNDGVSQQNLFSRGGGNKNIPRRYDSITKFQINSLRSKLIPGNYRLPTVKGSFFGAKTNASWIAPSVTEIRYRKPDSHMPQTDML